MYVGRQRHKQHIEHPVLVYRFIFVVNQYKSLINSQKGVFYMKNTIKHFGIIAIIAVISFSAVLFSCESGPPYDGPPEVSIRGTAKVGQNFTASSRGEGFDSGHGFEWFYTTSPVGGSWESMPGTGNLGSTFAVTGSYSSRYIRARRYNNGTKEYIYSNTIGPITN